MMRLGIAVALLAAFPALGALRYRIDANGIATTATLHASRVDGESEPIRQSVAIPSHGTIDAIGEGTWQLRIESAEAWARDVYVSANDEAVLVAQPAATLLARVRSADAALPAEVRVLLSAPASTERTGEPPQVICPVTEGTLTCTLPAGTWDLRVSATGFAPLFQWNVRLAAGSRTKLDPLTLIRGASVIGVVTTEGGALPKETRVTLVPAGDASTTALSVQPDVRGRFTFAAVAPGEYLASAASGTLASDSRRIRVVPHVTAELNEPLLLAPPRTVRARIFPALDPDGAPWHATLSRVAGASLERVASAAAAPDGIWLQGGIRPGAYQLDVTRADGSRWTSQVLEVANEDADVAVTITAVAARGIVRYGEQPVAARLTFGGASGAQRQHAIAGEDGRFTTPLPAVEGHTWDIVVESDAPQMRRTLRGVRGREDGGSIVFQLTIPRTAMLGSVVDSEGKPQPHAIVTARAASGDELEQVTAGADGMFQFSGLAPGDWRVMAETALAHSDELSVTIAESDTPPARLVLRPTPRLKGRVLAGGRIPVTGASVEIIRRNGSPATAHAITNEAGAFLLLLPPETAVADLLVAPPGFAATMARIPVRADKELLVDVDAAGGTLVVDYPSGVTPMLAHGGANLALSYVASTLGAPLTEGERHSVALRSMERGEYTLCAAGKCTSGYLPPHGALQLSLR